MVLISSLETKSLARIVADDFRAAEVFERYNLDFCCKGKRTLAEACLEKGLPLESVRLPAALDAWEIPLKPKE